MAGISGSDVALMQNRAGIGRAGATRAGYFTPNVVLLINGTDRSTALEKHTLRITQAKNDEPDTCSFTLKPLSAISVTVGHAVVIGLGTSSVREFAGQILRAKHRRRRGNEYPWIDVDCIDYLRLFDRRLITTTYEEDSASTIIADIVDTYTSGFTQVNVASGLPNVTLPPLINARPSAVLRDIAALLGQGAGFVIDPNRDLHFWGTSGESGYRAPTAPVTLTNSLASLKGFTHTRDGSQIRNRVIAEGRTTKVLRTVPTLVSVEQLGIPIEYGWMFDPAGGVVRIGVNVFSYVSTIARTGVIGPPAALVTADLNPGDTTGAIADNTDILDGSTGLDLWMHDEAGNLFRARTFSAFPLLLTAIPSSGYGSVQQTIPAGTAIYSVDSLEQVTHATFGQFVPVQIEEGEQVYVRIESDDAAEQTALAAIEGGDGIHEHLISDSAWSYLEAGAAADAELTAFDDADGLIFAEWETEDMNAKPGTRQVINLTVTDALSATVTIDRATLTFIAPNYRPRRRCQGSTTPLSRLTDVIAEGPPR